MLNANVLKQKKMHLKSESNYTVIVTVVVAVSSVIAVGLTYNDHRHSFHKTRAFKSSSEFLFIGVKTII